MTAPAVISRYGKGTDSDASDTLIAGPLGGGNDGVGRRTEDDPNLVLYNPHRTLQSDGSVLEGFAEREIVDALHQPTGNKEPLLAVVKMSRTAASGWNVSEDQAPTLDATSGRLAVNATEAVRRLTPTECCRLQGFPDDWLGTPNEPPDSPRYAALGDAVTVNVAHWIGNRIMEAKAAA